MSESESPYSREFIRAQVRYLLAINPRILHKLENGEPLTSTQLQEIKESAENFRNVFLAEFPGSNLTELMPTLANDYDDDNDDEYYDEEDKFDEYDDYSPAFQAAQTRYIIATGPRHLREEAGGEPLTAAEQKEIKESAEYFRSVLLKEFPNRKPGDIIPGLENDYDNRGGWNKSKYERVYQRSGRY